MCAHQLVIVLMEQGVKQQKVRESLYELQIMKIVIDMILESSKSEELIYVLADWLDEADKIMDDKIINALMVKHLNGNQILKEAIYCFWRQAV